MNDQTNVGTAAQTTQEQIETVIEKEQAVIYAQAAALFREGKKDEALNLIRLNISEEAAKEAELVMDEVAASAETPVTEPTATV